MNFNSEENRNKFDRRMNVLFKESQLSEIESIKDSGKFASKAAVVRHCVRKQLPELMMEIESDTR